MKKLAALLLIIMFLGGSSSYAFAFKIKKTDPLCPKEKLEFINLNFWAGFEDAILAQYIVHAVVNNHDVRKASWLVEEYRQNVKYSFGKELPSLGVSANYAGIHVPRFDNFQLSANAFILPFYASYEPDFLLKNRDKTRSQKKAYEASKFEEQAVYISLAGDVASAYINLMQYDKLIDLQTKIVSIEAEKLERDMKKYKAGVINNTQLNASALNLETQKNNLNNFCKERETLLSQFAVLLGEPPDCKHQLIRNKLDNFDYRKEIPNSIASEIIFSRPDVLSVEKQLDKMKIDVRVARKEFLPSFNLIGVWAFNTIAPGSFFSWQSSLAAIAAGASQDIFKGGQKIANLRIKKAQYEQIFEQYHQTNLKAAKEVNDALFVINCDTKNDENTINQLNLKRSDYQSAQNKYNRGTISYPDLISEQQRLLGMEQNQAQTKTRRIVNYITLYKAVGGKL